MGRIELKVKAQEGQIGAFRSQEKQQSELKRELGDLKAKCQEQLEYLVLVGLSKAFTKDKLVKFIREEGGELFGENKSVKDLVAKASDADLFSMVPDYMLFGAPEEEKIKKELHGLFQSSLESVKASFEAEQEGEHQDWWEWKSFEETAGTLDLKISDRQKEFVKSKYLIVGTGPIKINMKQLLDDLSKEQTKKKPAVSA